MITYKSICEKIGIDPIKDGKILEPSNHEDDTPISPFSVLTTEELVFLTDYLMEHRQELKQYRIS